MHHRVLAAFGIHPESKVKSHGNGLINRTWHVEGENQDYILQKLNDAVFNEPTFIAENIERVSRYISSHFPSAIFPKPLETVEGSSLVYIENAGYFRVYPFIRNSITIAVVETTFQAREASKKFGEFTRMLCRFPIEQLHDTLPGFHDLSLRYNAFSNAAQHGNPARIKKSLHLIRFLESQSHIVHGYEQIKRSPEFRRRVTHHDTKISNVLFDEHNRGLCVIDLDTMMPGYFISDVGDMFRTYISPVSEEEEDFSKIEVRLPYVDAIMEGYLEEMSEELTDPEKNAFVFAGEFMMYMQSLRFLTDYLNNDIYYGSKYDEHNFVRAGNQATLLTRFQEKSGYMKEKISAFTGKSHTIF